MSGFGFHTLALLTVIGVTGPLLASLPRFQVPVIIGELVAGLVVGRTGFGIVDSGDATFTLLANVGFALVMFVVGSHVPIRDKTLPTVIACIDATLRRFGGVPTYGLSDNEKTLTLDHIARIAVRHPTMVEVGHHYGLTLASCVPADPQSKGGSEATVRIAAGR